VLRNWFFGDTRNPQHATVAAVITSLGFREEFVRDHTIDIEVERKRAAEWLKRQGKTKKKRKQKNGHRKRGRKRYENTRQKEGEPQRAFRHTHGCADRPARAGASA